MTSDQYDIDFSSGNSAGRSGPHDHRPENESDRAHNLKYAIFYSTVAVLLILANQLAKYPGAHANQPEAAPDIRLNLSISRESETARMENESTAAASYVIRFRLTNQGNRPIYYPVDPTTNSPMGHIVYRAAPGSEWIPEKPTTAPSQTRGGSDTAWVEMPPGGWVDGMYEDPGLPAGDHAYELELKISTNDKVTGLFSQPYRLNAN